MDPNISTETQTYQNLQAGEVTIAMVLADSAATIKVGQVLQYDSTNHNFVNFTSGIAAAPYVVCTEAQTITADTYIRAIVGGYVNHDALDATSQADADIDAALLHQGIIVLHPQV